MFFSTDFNYLKQKPEHTITLEHLLNHYKTLNSTPSTKGILDPQIGVAIEVPDHSIY